MRLHNLYAEDSDDEEEVGQEDVNKVSSSVKQTVSSNRLRTVEVEIDLSMSAYANVARMYGHKKVAQAKEIKTLEVPILNEKELCEYAVIPALSAVLYLSRLQRKERAFS